MKKHILITSVLLCAILFSYGQSINTTYSGISVRTNIPDHVRERKAYKRAECFFNQRAFPYDTLPNVKYHAILSEEMSIMQDRRAHTSASTHWNSIGPYGSLIDLPSHGVVSGRVKAVAVHPTDPLTVYIGAANGGIWKTTDGGNSWMDIGAGLSSLSFGAIAIDPNNPETVYAGSGESNLLDGFYYYSGTGLYKTSDGGLTWDLITNGFGTVTHFGDLAVSPYNSNVLLAAMGGGIVFTGHDVSNEGIWKSTDAGITWTRTLELMDASDVAFHPTDPNKVFGAAGGYFTPMSGFFVSIDQGNTWSPSNSGLSLPSIGGRMQFDISKSDPDIMYAVIYSLNDYAANGSSKAYKSADGGNTWSQISVGTNLGGYYDGWYDQGWYDLCIAVDPVNPNHVLIGNVELHRTTNGNNFYPFRPNGSNALGSLAHEDYHQLVYAPSNPDILYIGCDGGIYKSLDKGYTATSKNLGLATLQFYRITSHPTNPEWIMGGMQDNMSTITRDGGSNWNRIFGADGMECFFDRANPDNILYGSIQNGGLVKSVDGGASWSLVFEANGAWTTPFFAHPVINSTLYTANKKIYKSTNAGASFSVISGIANVTTSNISSMAQSQVDPQKMIISTGIDYPPIDTIFYVKISTDEGQSWKDVTANIPGETRWISRVVTDPVYAGTMYVLRTGFSSGNKVWKTIDLGQTWTNISGNLPDLPCNDLFIYPENPQQLFVANDIGVYHSSDGGVNWNNASEGMPFVPAIDFDYVEIDSIRYLRVGTHGRSIYETKLDASLGVPEPDAKVTSSSFGLVRTYPNPNNSISYIEYELLHAGNVELVVHNHLGQQVDILVNMKQAEGKHQVAWNTASLPAGTYNYRLQTGNERVTGKIIKIK